MPARCCSSRLRNASRHALCRSCAGSFQGVRHGKQSSMQKPCTQSAAPSAVQQMPQAYCRRSAPTHRFCCLRRCSRCVPEAGQCKARCRLTSPCTPCLYPTLTAAMTQPGAASLLYSAFVPEALADGACLEQSGARRAAGSGHAMPDGGSDATRAQGMHSDAAPRHHSRFVPGAGPCRARCRPRQRRPPAAAARPGAASSAARPAAAPPAPPARPAPGRRCCMSPRRRWRRPAALRSLRPHGLKPRCQQPPGTSWQPVTQILNTCYFRADRTVICSVWLTGCQRAVREAGTSPAPLRRHCLPLSEARQPRQERCPHESGKCAEDCPLPMVMALAGAGERAHPGGWAQGGQPRPPRKAAAR